MCVERGQGCTLLCERARAAATPRPCPPPHTLACALRPTRVESVRPPTNPPTHTCAQPTILVMGNEGYGMRTNVRRLCDVVLQVRVASACCACARVLSVCAHAPPHPHTRPATRPTPSRAHTAFSLAHAHAYTRADRRRRRWARAGGQPQRERGYRHPAALNDHVCRGPTHGALVGPAAPLSLLLLLRRPALAPSPRALLVLRCRRRWGDSQSACACGRCE